MYTKFPTYAEDEKVKGLLAPVLFFHLGKVSCLVIGSYICIYMYLYSTYMMSHHWWRSQNHINKCNKDSHTHAHTNNTFNILRKYSHICRMLHITWQLANSLLIRIQSFTNQFRIHSCSVAAACDADDDTVVYRFTIDSCSDAVYYHISHIYCI